jgi:hypothetical protein
MNGCMSRVFKDFLVCICRLSRHPVYITFVITVVTYSVRKIQRAVLGVKIRSGPDICYRKSSGHGHNQAVSRCLSEV